MKCLVLLLCLGRLSHSQDSSTVNNDYYPELTADVISETYDISDPYDIPILSDNVVRTEPFQQQEVLPLLSTNVIDSNDQADTLDNTEIDPEVTDPEDMCRVSTGESNIVMDIAESMGKKIDAVMPDVVSSRKQGPIKAEPGPADSPNVTAVEGVAGGGDQMDVDGTTEIPAEKSTVLKVVIVWLIVKILLPVALDVILTQTV